MSRALLPACLLLLAGAAQVDRDALFQHRNLGKAFYENPTTQAEAVEQFRKALALAPGSARDRLNYGLALLRANRTDEGVAELEKVQRQDPSLPHTWFNLGIVYKQRGDVARALAQFRRMVELVPDEPISRYNLGYLYKQQGDRAAALREFETAARLDPDFAAPLYQIFTAYREQGRAAEAARALERFTAVKQRRERQEGRDAAPEDVNWSAYSEVAESIPPQPAPAPAAALRFEEKRLPGQADAQSAGTLVLDAFGDGRASLLVWSASGILLFRDGDTAVDAGLGSLRGVISAAAGDYNNDGLPDLCILTGAGPALYLNRGGRFERQNIALPARRFNQAVWLDYDHDYDLDLLLLGERPALFRNQGPAGFAERTEDFPFAPGEALGAVEFRLVPDSKASDVAVSYRAGPGVIYRDRLAGRYEAQPSPAITAGATGLLAFDADNDSWVDLAFTSPAGIALLSNRHGRLEPRSISGAGPFTTADLQNRAREEIVTASALGLARLPQAAALASADFDRDGRKDLAAVAPDGTVRLFLNRTATANHWLGVRLTGVRNLKLVPGAEVEIKAGPTYQKKLYAGVPLVFGAGPRRELDVVRISWPNGMIQNATRQPLDRFAEFQEAPRLSGSCPMIFTWDGRGFRFITDVLGVAPLGASSGDGRYFPVDHDEYVQIPGEALAPVNGRYEVRITEELSEVTYLDQVRLLALDHPAATDVFTNDKWKGPPFPEFRLFGVARRVHPIGAPALLRQDRIYAGEFRRSPAGVAETHSLELDFGNAARENRAVLVLNGWVDWADGSTFRAASQESAAGLAPPYLQVKDGAGRWKTVIEDMGMPSGKSKTIAVDLTGKFEGASRKVRIVTNLCVYWDEIFLGESAAPPIATLTPATPVSADLHFRGFSQPHIDPRRLQPEYFDYARVSPVSLWNQTPGLYTRYGDVLPLVREPDDRYIIMGSGDEARLSFDGWVFPVLRAGWKREFLLLVDGWAKDRDSNTAFSQTVEPLPFHGMSSYPYPAPERYPEDAAHTLYRRTYNTRPALRLSAPLVTSALPARRSGR